MMLIKKYLTVLLCLSILNACQSTFLALNQRTSPSFSIFKKNSQRNPIAIIEKANRALKKRNPKRIERKYKKMADSAFSFFRATAYLFYGDIRQNDQFQSSIEIPLQGDLHLENMGTYRTTQNQFAYDLNDFDESASGPYIWELLRGAISIRLAAHEYSLSSRQQEQLIDIFVNAYQKYLEQFSNQPSLLKKPLISSPLLSLSVNQSLALAAKQSDSDFVKKVVNNHRFILSKKLKSISPQARLEIEQALKRYAASKNQNLQFYRFKDAVERIAGTASLGRYRYVVLVEGPTLQSQDDIILEFKETVPSAVNRSKITNHAQRVLKATKYFLPQSDSFLGITQMNKINFLVRQWRPKATVELELLSSEAFNAFVDTFALVTARAHARSGQGKAILQEPGESIKTFSYTYFQQVLRDYKRFKKSKLAP